MWWDLIRTGVRFRSKLRLEFEVSLRNLRVELGPRSEIGVRVGTRVRGLEIVTEWFWS